MENIEILKEIIRSNVFMGTAASFVTIVGALWGIGAWAQRRGEKKRGEEQKKRDEEQKKRDDKIFNKIDQVSNDVKVLAQKVDNNRDEAKNRDDALANQIGALRNDFDKKFTGLENKFGTLEAEVTEIKKSLPEHRTCYDLQLLAKQVASNITSHNNLTGVVNTMQMEITKGMTEEEFKEYERKMNESVRAVHKAMDPRNAGKP